MNNGEKIDDKIIEDIFTLFFSRKKDGRGIGLYLAKKVLIPLILKFSQQTTKNTTKWTELALLYVL